MFLETLPEIFRVRETHLVRYLRDGEMRLRHKILGTLHTDVAYEIVRRHVSDTLDAGIESRTTYIKTASQILNLKV